MAAQHFSFFPARCIASTVLATAIPSVPPSVRPSVTRRYCVKMTARNTMQFALSDRKICLVLFCTNHKIFPRDDLFSLKSWLQVTYPLLIRPSLVTYLPCSASTVRASEKSSIMANRKFYTGFPTSHHPRIYAAPNFLKMGINCLNLSFFGQFRQYRTKSLQQSFII